MEKGNSNPSLSLDTLFPTLNDESFLQFLKDYYKFLQSTKLTLTDVSGTFVKGELITGSDSKATATVFYVGTNEIIVVMNTEAPLDSTEVITGSTSGATATISLVKDNVIRESSRLKDSRSQYVSGDEFFQLLKDEVNRGYPSTSEADRRLLYNRIRDLLQSKSTEEAYRFLFKAFFDENIEIRFPGDDILRVSDGNFEKTSLIRVIPTNTNPFPVGGIFDFLNKTIRGQTSGAVGTVVNISISFLGGVQYAEFNLKLVSGEFQAGETVADVLQSRLSTEVYGIIGDIQINDGGSGYSVGDQLTITGDGAEATAEVSSISTGPINSIIVNTPGYGYRLNTRAAIDNTDTAGNGLAITVTSIANTYTVTDGTNNYTVGDTNRIQIVSRGSNYQRTPTITLVDSTIQALGLLSERLITIANSGTDYAVGELLTFTGGAGANAAGQVASVGNTSPFGEENILFEDDFILVQEQEVNGLHSAIKSEDWGNLGSILRIELTNLGDGYASNNLPTLTIESANTVSGANASFTVNNIQGASANVTVDIANNSVGIGSIRQIDIRNPGINFSSANVDATSVGDGNANLEAIISGLNVNRGFFTNDDGKVNYKIIQDSFFYQDFSYVIRSGLIIDAYKELVKETVHPAGLEFFGEIVITSIIALTAEFRSQIDQTPRPLALRSFLSLWPAVSGPPPVSPEVQVHLEPLRIDQALIGVNDFNIREIEIVPQTIETISTFEQGSIDKIDFYLPTLNVGINIDDVKTDVGIGDQFYEVTIQNYANSLISTYSANTFFDPTGFTEEFFYRRIDTQGLEIDIALFANVALQIVFNDVEIAETSISEVLLKVELGLVQLPVSVRDFNIREIEITPRMDSRVIIDQVKTYDYFADTFDETPLVNYAEQIIITYSANTFLDTLDVDPIQIYTRTFDTQGLEIDIELASTDLKIQTVSSTTFGTESEVPLFISVPLIDVQVAELVNRLELYLDASLEIVYNDVQVIETSISDVVVKVFSRAETTSYYSDLLLLDYKDVELTEWKDRNFKSVYTVPLRSNGIVSQSYEVDIELPLVTVAATVEPFRIFVDRLRLPTLDTGVTLIDATLAFQGTSYEIETRPEFVQFAPRPIPQTTGRLKRLTYVLPPVTATIPNIYEVIKIQPQIDVAPIPRMKLEIDVPPGFAAPFKSQFFEVPIATLAFETISNEDFTKDYTNKTFLDYAYRYTSLSSADSDYVIKIHQFLDSRMRFYSEILTMTNREMTVEIDVLLDGASVSANYSSTYEIDIEPVKSQVISLFIPTEDHLGNTERQISLYVDLRMSFYSEIYTMTNRIHTTEIEIQSVTSVASNHSKSATFNYFSFADVPISGFLSSQISDYQDTIFNDDPNLTFTVTSPLTKYEIDIQSASRRTFGDSKLETFADDQITAWASTTFDSSVNRNLAFNGVSKEVVSKLEPQELANTILIFDQPIPRTLKPEINVGLISDNKVEIDSISSTKYFEAILGDFAGDSITKLAEKNFNDNVALGAGTFNERFWHFSELTLRSLENDPIEGYGGRQVSEAFINKNVQKNVLIDGTVTFADPGFSGIRINRLVDTQVDTFSANTFNDLSGSNTSVIGTNTEFTVDYLINESVITNSEKFLVTNVANNTYLEVNVNPEENYIDASVYREYFV